MNAPALHFDRLTAVLTTSSMARLLPVLNAQGHETRIVGGAVRNALLGQDLSDIDLATTMLPDEVIAACTAADIRTIPTGYEHGTITAVIAQKGYEITTLREDIATDGRRARVAFGRNFAHDAQRRDLTINALSLDAHGELHDYVNGLEDLAQRHVRFIGPARQRIKEDYLRSLRFFRFHAAYAQGPLDEEALHAIIAERDGIASLSKERIRAEMMKLLIAPRASDVLEAMSFYGISPYVMRKPTDPLRMKALTHLCASLALPSSALLNLAAYTMSSSEDVAQLRDDLRLSNAETTMLQKTADALMLYARHADITPHIIKEMLYRFGRTGAQYGLLLSHIDRHIAPDDAIWLPLHQSAAHMPIPVLPFSGADFIARGHSHGPALGARLKQAESQWIAADFPTDAAHIAALLEG